jgi:hypothetical protein
MTGDPRLDVLVVDRDEDFRNFLDEFLTSEERRLALHALRALPGARREDGLFLRHRLR